ncbi:S41 family peptidase [Natronoglycomyces albus]|uniref:Tricorn protease homolog n=1 Tax=Natronoglycomyces albus TaxID=2811108 RepID=A0A895XKY8_9ACTN|nr:S41 family peptidase [Natronoglycomyces albus]QSB04089.1 PDZ domain-containing protein [Natronoglycomyces albus]
MTAYPRFTAICGDTLAFVAEDDIWTVPASGGTARRITAGKGRVTHIAISPDGTRIAYVGHEEGESDIYVVATDGGLSSRQTYQGGTIIWVGWDLSGQTIRYASNAFSPHRPSFNLWEVEVGGQPIKRDLGYVHGFVEDATGTSVISRVNPKTPAAHRKRYRGGTAGHLWIDVDGSGSYRRMNELSGYIEDPHLIDGRLYFLSDFEGYANVYSCDKDGSRIQRHTDHDDFYARGLASDGRRLAYHAGGDLYVLEPGSQTRKVDVTIAATSNRKSRRFVDPMKYLHAATISHDGSEVVLNSRGKLFNLRPWDGPVTQLGEVDGTAYRLPTTLAGGASVLAVASAADTGEYLVELFTDGITAPRKLPFADFGRPTEIVALPNAAKVVMNNHRGELMLLDLEDASGTITVLDSSEAAAIADLAVSPDGAWVAYSRSCESFDGTELVAGQTVHLCELATGETTLAARNVFVEHRPTFDAEGKYLYFVGRREFQASYDSLDFNMSFMWGTKPYAVVLQKSTPAPFSNREEKSELGEEEDAEVTVRVDVDGLADRVVPVPLEAGQYEKLFGVKGKVLALSNAVKPTDSSALMSAGVASDSTLHSVDTATGKVEKVADGVTDAWLSADASTLLYRAGNRLRVVKATEKVPEGDAAGRESGWVDLGRVKVSVQPASEWPQMFAEAWRLQRDHFWNQDLGGLDWPAVFDRYAPLAHRVCSRSEFSDLIWEMHGELGTSHAYEMLGDYHGPDHYGIGHLAADLDFDAATGTYRVSNIAQGDRWRPAATSPLNLPGVNVADGDEILAVNGMPVDEHTSVNERLVNLAGQEVRLTVRTPGSPARTVTVTPLANEAGVRYRDWVEANRAAVHQATNGRIGYVHIPDMMADGYSEFHRGFLSECSREAMIVDLRFNGGGHVSQLLLDVLSRPRIGYFATPHGKPFSQPNYALRGPAIGITNEYAGSDGDIVSQTFKSRGIGTLIGKRTWGGVVGINVRFFLADNTLVTQPEAASHFNGIGWGIENYGVDPDIEVEFAPQDFAKGTDPQLEAAIAQAVAELEESPATRPELTAKPDLRVAPLPPRD